MMEDQQFCTFYLDNYFFGVEVEKVQEVFRYQEMTRVPLAAKEVEGLINLRGQIITAIDLRRRLEMPDREEGVLPMNVVVRTDDAAVSLLVDSIGDVLEVSQDDFEPPPDTIQGVTRELVRGVYKLEGKLLLILDTQKSIDLCTQAA
ncbi:MAG: chemotaxis protein CheW [Nitrospinae bacterium]|nr:chemotaxis protein CheW [Nitrospinota bacterium]